MLDDNSVPTDLGPLQAAAHMRPEDSQPASFVCPHPTLGSLQEAKNHKLIPTERSKPILTREKSLEPPVHPQQTLTTPFVRDERRNNIKRIRIPVSRLPVPVPPEQTKYPTHRRRRLLIALFRYLLTWITLINDLR